MKIAYIVRRNSRKIREFTNRHEALNWVRRKIRASKDWQHYPMKRYNPAPAEFGYSITKAA